MSSNKRAAHRRQVRLESKGRRTGPGYHVRLADEGLDPDAEYATLVAWCAAKSDLAEARRQTHDTLIAMLGDRRRGGVRWQQHTGADAVRALGIMREGATGELADHYRRVAGHLREYGGWLVVAMAEAAQ